MQKSSEDFILQLVLNLGDLISHDYVAKCQSNYIDARKKELQQGEVLVIGDFSENYTFVIQDAIQNYYWVKEQATIHSFVAYYKTVDNKETHLNFIVLSDEKHHDADVVNSFIGKLIYFLKQRLPIIQKIIYSSDGAPTQYKNYKNLKSLCYHR